MSKPSYAAVTAPKQAPSEQQPQGEAPPPYAASSSSQPLLAPPQHHNTTHPGSIEGQSQQADRYGWTPPSNPGVAKSRALRRFWSAFFVGWGIWILVGLIIGGGVSDIEGTPSGRQGHWDKHGDWKEGDWFGSIENSSQGEVRMVGEGSEVVIRD